MGCVGCDVTAFHRPAAPCLLRSHAPLSLGRKGHVRPTSRRAAPLDSCLRRNDVLVLE